MEINFLSNVCYCSKFDTKFISLEIFDQKKLFYSLHVGTLKVCDNSTPIMFSYLTAHNLYKIYFKEPTNLVTILY